MTWIKNLFSKSVKNDDIDKKELLLQNINHAILQSREEIDKLELEIEQIKKWTAEIIHDNFHVPGDFWYEELAHYNAIKENKENKSVEQEVITKSNELIKEYQSQIKFRETKKELNKMTITKYEETKQKILNFDTVKSISEVISEKPDTFQKHKKRIHELSQNPDDFIEEQLPQKQLENIIESVNELIENHEIEEEVKSFMQKLNSQFNTEMKSYDQNRLINEMEKLIEQYKSNK
ncbi:MAG: hypothetical protein DRJ10_01470 [Bacteroidetes bacterium]|nr:MAG: hypothetical protein DRJ10_01470 [Bacteroidota bacterium]